MIVNSWPPVVNGVGDYAFHLSKLLAQRGIEIIVLCSTQAERPKLPQDLSIRVFPRIRSWNRLAVLGEFQNFLKEQEPDIVLWQYVPHAFQSKGMPVFLPLLIAMSRSYCRSVVFFHEVRIKVNWSRVKSILNALPMFLISGMVHRFAHRSATSNVGYAKLLRQYGERKAVVIPVGSNIPLTNPASKIDKDIAEKLSKRFVLGCFGMGLRGRESIFSALDLLKKQGKSVHLLVIGKLSSEERETIDTELLDLNLREAVTITGYLPEQMIPAYLQQVDLYLMLEPSHSKRTWTGTSTRSGTLATAMGMSLPVIGVIGELTDDQLREVIYGLDKLDGEKLAETIKFGMENPNSLTEKSQTTRTFFLEHLSWERIVDQYVAWIHEDC